MNRPRCELCECKSFVPEIARGVDPVFRTPTAAVTGHDLGPCDCQCHWRPPGHYRDQLQDLGARAARGELRDELRIAPSRWLELEAESKLQAEAERKARAAEAALEQQRIPAVFEVDEA